MKELKKIILKKIFFGLLLLLLIITAGVQKIFAAQDYKLIPKIIKSSQTEGFYSKIPLSEMIITKGKLDFYKKAGFDFVSFSADYDEVKSLLTGIYTGARQYDVNKGYSFYCEFTANIDKDKKTTTFEFYSSQNSDLINHCYSEIIFDIAKNSRSGPIAWSPDNIVFDIVSAEDIDDSNARFSDIYGEVEILLPTDYDDNGEPIFDDEEGWNFAKLDMPLPYGTKIKLKARSGIIIAFPGTEPYEMKTPDNLYPYDETIIILPTKQKKYSLFKILGGTLYNNVKKIITEGTMDIEMGQAVAGIKGTSFILEEDGKTSKLKVLEGEVEFASKTNSQKELLKSGEMINADNNGIGKKLTFSVEEEKTQYVNQSPKENRKPSTNLLIALFAAVIIIGGFLVVKIIKKNMVQN